jgi:hypothetical protein
MGRITAFVQRVFKFTYYDKSALERLEGQETFKFRAFWSVRGGKGLNIYGNFVSNAENSFNLQYPLYSSRSSSRRLLPLPRLTVTSILPSGQYFIARWEIIGSNSVNNKH